MPSTLLSSFDASDLTIRYLLDPDTGRVGLELIPSELKDSICTPRIGPLNQEARPVDSLVQFKLRSDGYTGPFAQGHTMRGSPSLARFRYQKQETLRNKGETTIVTQLASAEGLGIEHRLAWHEGDRAFRVTSSFHNGSSQPVTLEMFSSFSLSKITPFDSADAPERLRIHRFRSVWSAEGRHECRSIEELHLERSWGGSGIFCERFGQVGSMPVRKWFPFAAIEDTVAGVTWAAQLAWAGSWQIEIFRQFDDVCLSGGLADREFGHWMKTLAPGEALTAPEAFITCVRGGLDDACDRLTALQHRAADQHPAVEADLPVVFNEWCTTWGEPKHEKVADIARSLHGSGIRYFVIDAGWYKSANSDWYRSHGDWNPSPALFPKGLKAAADSIREQGLIPGLWFEMETCGSHSTAFSLADHLLKRDGLPVISGDRSFWDLSDPWVVDYLSHKVIDILAECEFGYLKVDYNDTIGIGSDHPDSLGEGLRRQTEGTYRFFDRIRERLPNLVIENCSSGGHRLEPSMIARTAMSSFSDAHEEREIPIIAANLLQLMLPRQCQIWAVLRRRDDARRLTYSLAAGLLGRLCLSGEIDELTPEQWTIVRRGLEFYRKAAPIIKHGTSRRFGAIGASWRHPSGWQAVRRVSDNGNALLAVAHGFKGAPTAARLPLPPGSWRITDEFPAPGAHIDGTELILPFEGDFSARATLLMQV